MAVSTLVMFVVVWIDYKFFLVYFDRQFSIVTSTSLSLSMMTRKFIADTDDT